MLIDQNLSLVAEGRAYLHHMLVDYRKAEMPAWVTGFHPERLACKIEEPWIRGSHNLCIPVVFSNNEQWIVRFPREGMTRAEHIDEKVASEVAALQLLRARTDIPVPEVKAWGFARDNRLGTGAFIMEVFMPGESLSDILSDPEDGSVPMRDNLGVVIDNIYRQLARFMVQIFDLDFSDIGSLYVQTPCTQPPLTLAANEISCLSGADVLGPRSRAFSSTTEYFHHVVEQHWQQFTRQRNSVDDSDEGRENYVFHRVLKSLTDHQAWPEHDAGPFKLICDDFGPANMLVNNSRELKIVGVVDLEWSYAGPAQLFATAPWWLLQERPSVWLHTTERRDMFLRHWARFKQILEEEEARLRPEGSGWLSALVKRSEENGTMWYHMVLGASFIAYDDFPSVELRASIPDWEERAAEVSEEDIQSFLGGKKKELEAYEADKETIQPRIADVQANKMTDRDLVAFIEGLYGRGGYGRAG
ncbi:hypothetical protein B0T17DRAFT_546778 [Bombardia bombarda]|uniref:Aminoglycoside phosphotransferase domain-containing protein n=1 Tax=Bombardia bombarda TaxID=252184 RepID=A0AA39W9J0_9PEZI|nr:hypothetical protein B0T17DRAFT_546778 [Bombardia bombarda]